MIGYVTLGNNIRANGHDTLLAEIGAKRLWTSERGIAWGVGTRPPGSGSHEAPRRQIAGRGQRCDGRDRQSRLARQGGQAWRQALARSAARTKVCRPARRRLLRRLLSRSRRQAERVLAWALRRAAPQEATWACDDGQGHRLRARGGRRAEFAPRRHADHGPPGGARTIFLYRVEALGEPLGATPIRASGAPGRGRDARRGGAGEAWPTPPGERLAWRDDSGAVCRALLRDPAGPPAAPRDRCAASDRCPCPAPAALPRRDASRAQCSRAYRRLARTRHRRAVGGSSLHRCLAHLVGSDLSDRTVDAARRGQRARC